MGKVQANRNEPVELDLAKVGVKEVIYNFGIGQEKLNKASFTISSEGIDAADTTVALQASNTKGGGFLTVKDNAGADIIITLPVGADDNAIFLREVGFSYYKCLVTRGSSTVGVVTVTSR